MYTRLILKIILNLYLNLFIKVVLLKHLSDYRLSFLFFLFVNILDFLLWKIIHLFAKMYQYLLIIFWNLLKKDLIPVLILNHDQKDIFQVLIETHFQNLQIQSYHQKTFDWCNEFVLHFFNELLLFLNPTLHQQPP